MFLIFRYFLYLSDSNSYSIHINNPIQQIHQQLITLIMTQQNYKINKKSLFDLLDEEPQQFPQSILNQKLTKDNQSSTHPNNSTNQKPQQKPQAQYTQQDLSFNDFALNPKVKSALQMMGYTHPTRIQSQSLPHSLQNNDMLCLSQTGSGKTLSFVLPIVNYICQNYTQQAPPGLALILAPTRQLCTQIKQYFDRFNQCGLSNFMSVVIFGGVDPMKQVIQLSKQPSVIVSTPGRLLDHLTNTKGFSLEKLRFLVLDEADKLLNKDFELQFNQILSKLPTQRNAFLYSATLTHKVEKLQRVSLKNPKRVEVSQKYQTVSNLDQYYVFIPSKLKDCYLLHLLHRTEGKKTIVFAQTKLGSQRIAMLLQQVGEKVQCLHGDMSQIQRQIGLQKFKKDEVKILVCTEVAARGLDINMVQVVINYDLCDAKSYVHRVGRTARIGNSGISISMVTQYDVETFQKIEEKIGEKMKEFPTYEKQAELFLEKLEICHHEVTKKMKLKHRKSEKMGGYK